MHSLTWAEATSLRNEKLNSAQKEKALQKAPVQKSVRRRQSCARSFNACVLLPEVPGVSPNITRMEASMITRVARNLYRGPRPKSFEELKALGIKHVISLQSGAEDLLTESVYEHEVAESFGIVIHRFHWSDITPPTRNQIIAALSVVGDGFTPTYVHCHSGVDRTGVLIMFWRIVQQKWIYQWAEHEWIDMGRHWWYGWWSFILKRYRL